MLDVGLVEGEGIRHGRLIIFADLDFAHAPDLDRGSRFAACGAFYQLGGCLERADMTSRILDVKYHIILPDLSMVGSALDYYQWAALLKSLSGYEAFRRSYHTGFMPADVAEFVVLNRDFPRSIVFSVDRMGAALQIIGLEHKDATRAAFSVISEMVGVTSQQIFDHGLHEYLNNLLGRLTQFHGALAEEFFQ